MAKITRKIKKWFEYYGRNTAIALLVAGILGAGVWNALTPTVEVVAASSEDVVDEVLLEELVGVSYDEGLRMLADGEDAKGRAVIQLLAPLTTASKKASGEPLAHLWMAKDLLNMEEFGFLEVYPIAAADGKQAPSPVQLAKDDVSKRCLRHLQAAVELDSQLREAAILLAEVLLAQDQRNAALEALHGSLAMELDLGIELANLLRYEGDDLGVEEASWHAFATLGRAIAGTKRGSMGARMEYILYAMVLKQSGLADSAINKFERDFGERTEGAKLVKNLRACAFYFKATDLLSADTFDAKLAVKFLLDAHQKEPGRPELVNSLKLLVERYPELKQAVEAGIGEVSNALETSAPTVAADLHVFLASLRPDQAEQHLNSAYALSPDEPAIVVAWSRYADDSHEVERAAERAMAVQNRRGSFSQQQRFSLLLALSKIQIEKSEWAAALISLERALAAEHHGDDTELHRLLGLVYAELGMASLSREHQELAGN